MGVMLRGSLCRKLALCRALAVVCMAGVALAGCADIPGFEYDEPTGSKTQGTIGKLKQNSGGVGLFGASGLSLFGGGDDATGGVGAPIPVNSYLWRATLDTLSFMPLASADPFGGVIITDWFTPQESVNERFKMTAYILSRSLRSDGLRVSVFRQVRDDAGNWTDAEVTEGTARQLEDGILARARELRVAGLAE